MADEVLRLITLADVSKAIVEFKKRQASARSVATTTKDSRVQASD
jgi:hypothetical protein